MEATRAEAFEAVRAGDAARLAALIAADGSLAAARDDGGVSLLMQACYQRKPAVVELIRAAAPPLDIFEAAALPGGEGAGADLLASDPALVRAWSSDGFTPLHLASFFGSEAMAALLLDGGADPNAVARNPMRVRPLHSAAACRATGIVMRLLEHGANVNARQEGGWTPLHAVAMFGDLPLVELLLAHGARPDLANDQGTTPLELALQKGHTQVAERLGLPGPGA